MQVLVYEAWSFTSVWGLKQRGEEEEEEMVHEGYVVILEDDNHIY